MELSTVANSSLGYAACLSKNPVFPQSSRLPLFKEIPQFLTKLRKSSTEQKEYIFLCRDEVTYLKLRKNESKAKENYDFLLLCRNYSLFLFDETTGALLVDDVEPLQLLDVLVE